MPDIDTDLLLAHLEYAAWSVNKSIAFIDKLPHEAVTCPVVSSFPSICSTFQHLYQWDSYYLTHLKGGSIGVGAAPVPATYSELKAALPRLQSEIMEWARDNLDARKNVVLHGWAAWPTWQVVMQMANHTTHHLGQVLTLARQAGYEPGQEDWTDLILYYLQRFPTAQERTATRAKTTD
jgi:uncharacterized damage-inducible protein DinB